MSFKMTRRGNKKNAEDQEKADVFSQWPLVAGMHVLRQKRPSMCQKRPSMCQKRLVAGMHVLQRHVDTSTLARFATYWVFFDTY
jgi:hypothetical protein